MHRNVSLSLGLVNWLDLNKAGQVAVQKGNVIIKREDRHLDKELLYIMAMGQFRAVMHDQVSW